MSHGSEETTRLRANIEAQLGRLLAQLSDLDELRAELDDDEYAETRRDTMEQIKVRAPRGCAGAFHKLLVSPLIAPACARITPSRRPPAAGCLRRSLTRA